MAKGNTGGAPKPFSKATLRSKSGLEFVINSQCRGYADVAAKNEIDLLSDPAPRFVQFWPGETNDHYYVVACDEKAEGAVKLTTSKANSTAHFSFFLPMEMLEIPRPAKGRKERFPFTVEPNSPYGKALKVSSRPVQNEKVETRKVQ